MTKLWILCAALLLAGCAVGMSVTGGDGRAAGEGVVRLAWVEPHELQVNIDGKRYVGPWSTEHCTVESCAELYRQTPRLHLRHLRQGHATLRADNGDRLDCEWTTHLPKLDGICRSPDGRRFVLQGLSEPD